MNIVLVILGVLTGVYCLMSRRFPLLPVAAAFVVAGIWVDNMSVAEGWVFALVILIGLGLTWPKGWNEVPATRQWTAGVAVLAFAILMALPGDLFGNGYGWGTLFGFITVVLFVLGSTVITIVLLIATALLLIGTWGWEAAWTPGPAPRPSATSTSATPSPSASATSASPTPTASPSATTTPSGALVTDKKIMNWQQLETAASTDFKKLVDKSKPTQGNLGKAATWNSPATDARLVVVFASEAEISDEQARRVADVPDDVELTRVEPASGKRCYIQQLNETTSRVCPAGNKRIVLTLASTLTDSDGLGVVHGWGVVVRKAGDNRWTYWPITYQ